MSARYLARQSAQAIFTIVMIVLLNFLLFRMMPGSPDRVNPRNPNVTIEQRAGRRAPAGAWTSRSSRTSSSPIVGVDAARATSATR